MKIEITGGDFTNSRYVSGRLKLEIEGPSYIQLKAAERLRKYTTQQGKNGFNLTLDREKLAEAVNRYLREGAKND